MEKNPIRPIATRDAATVETPQMTGPSRVGDKTSDGTPDTHPQLERDDAISDVIRELNIARKNISMYPPSHRQVQTSLERAHGMLQQSLEESDLVFAAAKDRLLLDDHELDPKNNFFREFAATLNQCEIAGITFSPGLELAELFTCLELLSLNPEEIESRGGIHKALSQKNGVKHIRIQTIDYSKVHYTEENEIDSEEKATHSTDADVWQNFVRHLVTGADDRGSDPDEVIRDFSRLAVDELATLINEYKLDIKPAAAYYESVVSDYLQEPAKAEEEPKGDRFEFLVRFNTLLKGIRPELRRQFLDANLKQCSRADSFARVEALLGYFPDDLIIDVLKQTNESDTAISPSLMRLIQAISKTREVTPDQGSKRQGRPGDKEPADLLSADDASTLFDREDYQTYVTADYHETLEHFSHSLDKPSEWVGDAFPVEEYIKTLEDDNLEYQIARSLLAIMDEQITPEEYRDCARRVTDALEPLLQQGRFSFLSLMLATLKTHARDKSSPDIRALAGKVLESFHAQSFITVALTYLKTADDASFEKGSDLVVALGSAAVPDLLRMYCLTKSDEEEARFFDLLVRLGSKIIPEVRRRLQDPDAPFAHRLVKLICRIDGEEMVQDLKRLRQHENPEIRKQILEGLLRFKDPEGTTMLRELLRAEEDDVRLTAVALAGRHRVREVTDDLLTMIKTTPLFASHFEGNEIIIEALGEIGDPKAVPTLEKLAKTRWVINHKRMGHMRETLYRSLSGYPYEQIVKLLRRGRKGDDRAIRKICIDIAAGRTH